MRAEPTRRNVGREFVVREREQRTHKASAAPRRHAREPGWSATAQESQENRLDLIVAMVCRDEIARSTSFLGRPEPLVPSAPGDGLARTRSELEPRGLERHPVLL